MHVGELLRSTQLPKEMFCIHLLYLLWTQIALMTIIYISICKYRQYNKKLRE